MTALDWTEINRTLSPIKDFEDLIRRWQASFAYPFVRLAYNFSMPALVDYTRLGVGSDPHGRYTEYTARLIRTFNGLGQAGAGDLLDLLRQVETRRQFAAFLAQSGVPAADLTGAMKYLIYWVIPMEKYLSGLMSDPVEVSAALQALGGLGIRTNLGLLQSGITPAERRALSEASGTPEIVITGLVNRADFSRLPWASKATISNIIGAGYGSLSALATADPDRLYADFFAYGKSIGKNLKLGNEIENSHRLAKILPGVVEVES